MMKQFPKLVEHAFSFLRDAGYKSRQIDESQIFYHYGRVVILICWEPVSGEVQAYFGNRFIPWIGHPKRMFSLTDILEALGKISAEQTLPAMVLEESDLPNFLEEMAYKIKSCVLPALGDPEKFFARAEEFVNTKAETFMKGMSLSRARFEAERAWRQRNYKELVILLRPFEAELAESEKRKLRYASEHKIK